MAEETNRAEQLKNELFYKSKDAAYVLSEDETADADNFCEGYMNFLDNSKTEREAVEEALKLAKANGFIEFRKGDAGHRY